MAEPLVALFPLAPEHAARVLARALANVRGLGGPNSGRYPKGSGKKNNVASLTNHGDRAIIDHILEGHDVGVVIRHVGEHVGALDEWIKQKPDDVIVIVPRKPRDLDGSNSGRYPKGSSNKSKSTTQILLAHLPKAVHIRDTKFILPDGMRLAHNYDTHGEAIRGAFEASGDKKMAESLYGGYKSAYELMFKEGIVRYSGDYGGVQIGRPLTEKQAQIIADDWNHVYKKALPIDAYESKIFQPPFNADTIRNWSRSQFRTPLNRAAGGPNSGRYPRGSGKDPQSGIKLQRTGKQDVKIVTKDGIINASGLDIKDGDIFETLRKLAPGEYQLRFLYEPHTNRFIIGTSSIDRSHAEDLVDSGAGGFYDKYVKGWIGNAPVGFSGKTEPYIQFAHGLARHSMLELGFQGADRGEIFEAYSKALQFFVEHGASENTQLKGVGHFLRDSNGPLGELVPAYLAKRRAAGGPNSGRYPKGSTNNTGSALAGDLNEVLPRATVVKQWIADAGLYHGTSDDALASIKANGLIPGGSKGSDA